MSRWRTLDPREWAARLGHLSPRDRRALMLGAAILVPALAWVVLVRPYLGTLGELQDRAQAEHALLEREMAVLRESSSYPARIATAERTLARWEARLVQSPNQALAEAEVTAALEAIAREGRVLLEAVSATPDPGGAASAPPDGLRSIRLRVSGESDFPGILRFVRGLEASPLLFRIAGVSIQRTPGSEDSQPGAMSFEVLVEAFAPGTTEPSGESP